MVLWLKYLWSSDTITAMYSSIITWVYAVREYFLCIIY